MNYKFFKLGAAAAITVTGMSTISNAKLVAASTSKTAIKRVKINYLPGKGIKIWTSYEKGRFMGFRAKAGTEWNVVKTALDKSGKLWYMVGDNEWIQARYTIDVGTENAGKTANVDTKSKKSKLATLTSKAKLKAVKLTSSQKKKTATAAKKEKIIKAKQIVAQTLNKAAKKNTAQKAKTIANAAKKEVGKSYVWGAEGPNSFDCSGLVQYVYQKAGVTLPRTTYDQVKMGQSVSMSSLQPGDLLFWGSTTAPYHVAVYIGNNQYVNAATPDQGVILQQLSSYYYPTVAKRVI
ncbi:MULTISPECIES: C40 family peptidase [Lactobacillus]|uniref:NlpC/P60 family protein n=1 Tax=Lactobacillus xujianguonis TaxID=2495899 RepID=A0A437SVH3_9LACO|nr:MULTISPECIES: C40 family peptidase [Lactobacillus]RVU70929.1 NlpC/P60 family protein [Lactobacillus xujianguonis]RVU73561.1 NlpC/P60 family protein [Lactobacillus xujianguonis]